MPSLHGSQKLVAIAIDKDKGSQAALKWALEYVCQKGQRILLIHVKLRPPGTSIAPAPRLNEIPQQHNAFDDLDSQTRDLLLPFRVFCSRKEIYSQEIVLEDVDVSKALVEFVKVSGIEILVLGAAPKSYLFRLKAKDTPLYTLKGVPDFCSVYIIARGKVSTSRPASRLAPPLNSFRTQMLHQSSARPSVSYASFTSAISRGKERRIHEGTPARKGGGESTPMRSPFGNRKGPNGKPHEYSSTVESDISFVSSGRRPETSFPAIPDTIEDPYHRAPGFSGVNYRVSTATRQSGNSFASFDHDSFMPHNVDDNDSEMHRLKQELKRTMDMYNLACRDALIAKQKALELENWKMEEQKKHEETRPSEDSVKVIQEVDEGEKVLNKVSTSGLGYRRYTIEEIEDATNHFSRTHKIGEGIYGPVYKCFLDHTLVAVKVLRPDAAHERSQFHQEVERLSCIRHPNLVLLLGACPEYGCLVYEHMSYGSLKDHLRQRRKLPPLSWQNRFRIAAEIATSLLFLHQTKPEPIIHGCLKPKSILLDKKLHSKLSHVGLARLVPPSVADTLTQYSAVTSGYIDPEYQQTGILGVKSDVYSLGVLLLQMLTARAPMGLAHYVRRAIKSGALGKILDPAVPDWPVEEALSLAKLALQCCELGRIDRPDLEKIMPELERLRELSKKS